MASGMILSARHMCSCARDGETSVHGAAVVKLRRSAMPPVRLTTAVSWGVLPDPMMRK
jgi:hypothetical protein